MKIATLAIITRGNKVLLGRVSSRPILIDTGYKSAWE